MKFENSEEKYALAKFRNSKFYESFDESPFLELVKDSEHSDLIDGNCIVMKRGVPMFGICYISYFVDCMGHIASIKEGLKYDKSMEATTKWLSSDDFFVNKERYIAECDSPIYVWGIEHTSERNQRMAEDFAVAFATYQAAQKKFEHGGYEFAP
jgi:hypothetical protein